jgi:uncharacterized protein (TIGR03437 family)
LDTYYRAALVTGDFNGDHKADVAVLCDGQISVALGNGDGTLQAPVRTSFPDPVTHENTILVAADFNRDGKTDVAIPVDAGILVFLSTGGGKFGPPLLVPTPQIYAYSSVGAADVNGDGIIDLYSVYGRSLLLFAGHRDGTFGTPTTVEIGIDLILALAVADLNGDHIPDLLVETFGSSGSVIGRNPYATYAVLGKGAGTFAQPKLISDVGSATYTVGDFAGAGKTDIVLGYYVENALYSDDPYMSVLLGNGDGTFQSRITSMGFPGPFVAADFNGDGRTDLAQPAANNAVAILLSQGNGSFKPVDNPPQITGHPVQLTVADFDGDGKPDIAAITDAGVSILINTTPFNTLGGALNGASFARNQAIAPGSLVSIFGTGMASASAQASSIPLPASLGGVSVAFNGTPAALSFVSASQINAQVPWNASGTVNVVVTSGGTTFSPFQLQIASTAPGIFSVQSGAGQAIAINPDGSLAGPDGSVPGLSAHPANAGDPLVIFATGLGAVDPSIENGAASSDTLCTAINTPLVLIGGQPAQVLFAGLSPQFVGVNQINVIVPQVPAPGVVPLQIQAGSITSTDTVTIAVQNP